MAFEVLGTLTLAVLALVEAVLVLTWIVGVTLMEAIQAVATETEDGILVPMELEASLLEAF